MAASGSTSVGIHSNISKGMVSPNTLLRKVRAFVPGEAVMASRHFPTANGNATVVAEPWPYNILSSVNDDPQTFY